MVTRTETPVSEVRTTIFLPYVLHRKGCELALKNRLANLVREGGLRKPDSLGALIRVSLEAYLKSKTGS